MRGSVEIAGLAFPSYCNILIGDDDLPRNLEMLTCVLFDEFIGLIRSKNPEGIV